jgi:hypothetical protein
MDISEDGFRDADTIFAISLSLYLMLSFDLMLTGPK